MAVRARMLGGPQDGVWIGLDRLPPVIEFRFTRGDELIAQVTGGDVDSYGVQYHYNGESKAGAYGETYHLFSHYPARPKEKKPYIVSTTNIGKMAFPHRKVIGE